MSSGRDRAAPVVVAVGADERSATDAVDWAAAEAAVRGRPLCIVHAPDCGVPAAPFDLALPACGLPPTDEATRYVLTAAADRARAVASDLVVSAEAVPGPVVPALLAAAHPAALLVLGGRRGRVRALLTGSATAAVAGEAACPVAVVRARGDAGAARGGPRVVVGIGVARSAGGVLRHAFDAAAQRGVPLVAVHAWTPDVPADLEAVCGCRDEAEATAHQVLEDALAPWRRQFDGVPVVSRVVRADPARALVEASDGAALSVVGAPARTHLLAGIRSVTHRVLYRARGPVVVCPDLGVTGDGRHGLRREPPAVAG
ncbi:universal stress protein [Pseudonocardia nigra]|uniref:universal stress protein n=1 Tax=Pseudonocardia nigra TaxID=1921578 RepID=UPI0027E396D6|nr:universal stress protein [Pseudonocardia nigra]